MNLEKYEIDKKLELQIERFLNDYHFSTSHIGTKYLAEYICILYENINEKKILEKDCYFIISRIENVSVSQIERAIRYSITKVINFEKQHYLYSLPISKTTAKEIANYILLELRYKLLDTIVEEI